VHVVDPVPLHVEQARQAAGADPAAGFTAALSDARELTKPESHRTRCCCSARCTT
jgi:hypothetical protein